MLSWNYLHDSTQSIWKCCIQMERKTCCLSRKSRNLVLFSRKYSILMSLFQWIMTQSIRKSSYVNARRIPPTVWQVLGGYLPWPGGAYLGWGYLPWLGGTPLGQGGYPTWPGGMPTLAGGYLPWWGIPTLARGLGVPTLARGYPTFAGGLPTLARGVPSWLGWHTPPSPRCEQTENITFPHPLDVGGNNSGR